MTLFQRLLILPVTLLFVGCGQNHEERATAIPVAEVNTFPQVAGVLKHKLTVTLAPQSSQIKVTDELTLPSNQPLRFTLNPAFKVKANGFELAPQSVTDKLAVYQIASPDPSKPVHLEYEGVLTSTVQCDWLREPCAMLAPKGAYLDAASHWYPQSISHLHQFEMSINMPANWKSLSQGDGIAAGHWKESHPQTAIYLLAGPFKVYESERHGKTVMVYLQTPDDDLAQKYIEASDHYLQQYSDLIGPYPYGKFATVESFWETGWGMPSFTLLGPSVMRLPFILHTSLPHEILHNWWGNGVYVNPDRGNWSEGLTAYLSDHLMNEQQQQGAEYRRDALQKYALFSQHGRDLPLQGFTSRHDNVTQAVGYSKSLMVFRMLEKKLGSAVFHQALSEFYQTKQFQPADWHDLQTSFESASKSDLSSFFEQWIYRTGAPALSMSEVDFDGRKITFKLAQQNDGNPFSLDVPAVVEKADGSAETRVIAFSQDRTSFKLEAEQDITGLSIDPDFDVLRMPAQDELPASLNQLYAAKAPQIYFPAADQPAYTPVAANLRAILASAGTQPVILNSLSDADPGELLLLVKPDDAALDMLKSGSHPRVGLDNTQLKTGTRSLQRSLWASAAIWQEKGRSVVILDAPGANTLATLISKLPHYGRYSYLAIESGNEGQTVKGQWSVENSPLSAKK